MHDSGKKSTMEPSSRLPLESPRELAERTGVSVAAVRRLIRQGLLDHVFLSPRRRNAKIPIGAWERFIEQHLVRAEPFKLGEVSGAERASDEV